MNLIARLIPCKALPCARPLMPAPGPAPDHAGEASCGWFDSSHTLQLGLEVLEHAIGTSGGSAVLSTLLPLDAWLACELAGWPPCGAVPVRPVDRP